jgi:hypothetical protein
MAWETHLIALSKEYGKYSVVSSITGHIDINKLYGEKRLFDVTNEMTYRDEACVLSRREFPNYLKQEKYKGDERVRLWFESLPREVQFVIVHEAEWESGLGDS